MLIRVNQMQKKIVDVVDYFTFLKMERSKSCNIKEVFPCLNKITKQFSQGLKDRYLLYSFPVRPYPDFKISKFPKIRPLDSYANHLQVYLNVNDR